MPTNQIPALEAAPQTRLRVLIAEERAADVLPIRRALSQAFAPLEALAVTELDTFRVALENGEWDLVIVAEENLRCPPRRILEILAEDELALPLVLLTSTGTDRAAVGASAAAGCQTVPKDSREQLIEAVERAVRIAAAGTGRRRSDRQPA